MLLLVELKIFLLLWLFFSCSLCGGVLNCNSCDFVYDENDNIWLDGDKIYYSPGDLICLKPFVSNEPLGIIRIHGNSTHPIKISNCDYGQFVINTVNQWAVEIKQSSYIHVDGTGDLENNKYGIKVGNVDPSGSCFRIEGGSTNIEVNNVEVYKSGCSGITAKTDVACSNSTWRGNFVQYQTILHDNYIHDTRCEGYYIGASHYDDGKMLVCDSVSSLYWPHLLDGVRVYNNIIENTGRDCIQVGSSNSDVEVYDNNVFNCNQNIEQGHEAGIMVNPGTTGKFYRNRVDSSGYGIYILGTGNVEVYGNIIQNSYHDGFRTGDRNPEPSSKFQIYNNIVTGSIDNDLYFNSDETVNNKVFQNIFEGLGNFQEGVYTNQLSDIEYENNVHHGDANRFSYDGRLSNSPSRDIIF